MRYTLDSMLPLGAFEHCGNGKIRLHGGGGGGFIEDIGNFVSDTFQGASDMLSQIDPGPTIGNVGEEIDKGVNNAVPGGWGTVAAATVAVLTANPEILAAALPEEAAALTTEEILASQFGDAAFQLSPEFSALAPDAAAEALANGEISGLTSNATDMMLNGNPSLNPIDLANASVDPIQTLNAANNWTGPMTQNIGQIATDMAAQGIPSDVIANQLMQNYGIDQYAAANAAGIATAGGSVSDIASTLASDYGANMTGLEASSASAPLGLKDVLNAANTARQVYGLGKTAANILNPSNALRTSSTAPKSGLSGVTGLSDILGGSSSSGGSGALPGNLQATSLAAAPVTQGNSNMNLNQLKQLYPQLSTVDPRVLSALTGKTNSTPNYYSYGSGQGGGPTGLSLQGQGGTPSAGYPARAADEKATSTGFSRPTSSNASYNALASAGLSSLNSGSLPMTFKDGGDVHIPQFKTGTTGHFVQGQGDGQSDDIPAMLADGEYVFDADTVAALGNGSSKAGALQLDKMRKAIRKHKRAASVDKIPPKAKSPLEYLKG
jgi:hypothetical protein